jgi:hypothetical protein
MKKVCFQDMITKVDHWRLDNTCAVLSTYAVCPNVEQGKCVRGVCFRVSEYKSFGSIFTKASKHINSISTFAHTRKFKRRDLVGGTLVYRIRVSKFSSPFCGQLPWILSQISSGIPSKFCDNTSK